MTKVTYIGNKPTKESKHIELVKVYVNNESSALAEEWENCQLIKRNAKDGLDLILCFDDDGVDCMHLGHWNDGTTSNTNTICTVLGEDVAVKKGKGIEFVKLVITDTQNIYDSSSVNPSSFKNIDVIKVNRNGVFDIFYAYDNDRSLGSLYLGHLNDGFVE